MLTYLILIFCLGLIITAIVLLDMRQVVEQAEVETLAEPGRGFRGDFVSTRRRTSMNTQAKS